MPFSIDDKWRIMRLLEIDYQQEQTVTGLLDAVQSRSEVLVQQVQALIAAMEELNAEKIEASRGLIRADVIEWKPDRMCGINSSLSALRADLARAIGYPYTPTMPF